MSRCTPSRWELFLYPRYSIDENGHPMECASQSTAAVPSYGHSSIPRTDALDDPELHRYAVMRRTVAKIRTMVAA